jgi:hypothetical protein
MIIPHATTVKIIRFVILKIKILPDEWKIKAFWYPCEENAQIANVVNNFQLYNYKHEDKYSSTFIYSNKFGWS